MTDFARPARCHHCGSDVCADPMVKYRCAAAQIEQLTLQVAALTEARDQLAEQLNSAQASYLHLRIEHDKVKQLWNKAEIRVQALDAAASHRPNLREMLGNYLDGATLLRQREPGLILQDLFALIHDYDKAHALPAPPAAARREEPT